VFEGNTPKPVRTVYGRYRIFTGKRVRHGKNKGISV
jgi:hypothetical protein